MVLERRTARWALVTGLLLTQGACEKKSLPTPTSASKVAPSATSGHPIAFKLDPVFLADRPDEYTAPRRVLARIQGNLERVAAGKEPKNVSKDVKADGLETFVPAYRAVLEGDAQAADKLAQVAALAKKRLDPKIESAKKEQARGDDDLAKGHEIQNYVKVVSDLATAPVSNAQDLVLRLVATMRLVDAALLMESGHEVYDDSYDLFERRDEMFLRSIDHFRDGAWLRLPCSTILKQRAALEAADKRLGNAAGPLLSCPVPEKREHDYDLMERWAKNPSDPASTAAPSPPAPAKKAAPAAEPVAPPPPWNLDQAIEFMGENPDAAEKPLAEAAAKNTTGKLDYALFLQAFRAPSKERDAKIKKLMADVDKASAAAAKKSGDEFLVTDSLLDRKDYNGTDESLVGSIRVASSIGAAQTASGFYAIPCAILLVRPKLLEATEPIFGSNRDNFLPRAGCGWGRGFVKGFPSTELDTWRNASEEADGKYLFNFSGTMRFALASSKNLDAETLSLNPREYLKSDPPTISWPYETWSYMTPESRTIYKRLFAIAEPLKNKLVAHYKTRGINDVDAERIAHAGLFQVVWGASCGEAAPPRSLRKLVLDGASAGEISAFVNAGEHQEEERLEPFRKCAEVTGIDPLIHMAVLNPGAMSLLWELFPKPVERAKNLDIEVDPNTPNAFGKTALMVAAQQDQIESARLLLDRGAALERTTFKKVDNASGDVELAHDMRTALMYAATRGSLGMIRLLLDRGADKYAADTMGRRAVHYLLGQGPVAANAKLSAGEFAEAVKLLY